ncbi:MAG: hypothetical protein NBV77_03095 [Bacteroidia bacterium]|nr:hypothetical protein [Bacteroidia bacterium]
MKLLKLHKQAALAACFAFALTTSVKAQTDTATSPETTTEDEDFSMYDEVGFADKGAKRYCSPKIEGLSPAKLISIGFDFQGPYQLNLDTFNNNMNEGFPENGKTATTSGARFACNIPVISKTSLVWQMGANYWESGYNGMDKGPLAVGYVENPMLKSLYANGLRTMGINTTVFKPLNDKKFLLFQGSADMSGDYNWNLMPAKYMKYSAALIYGKRPSERKQWGVGLARTYRAGELNYIPIIFFNHTDAANKWGSEVLFPARAHVRRTINSRNMLFAGYELEGQSYRLYRDVDHRDKDLEIRRAEIRLRAVYEFSLKDFIWMSVQAGYRINYRYDVDRLTNGKEIYRAFGLLSDEPYVMTNTLTNPFYFNVSLNLVSP